MPKAIPLDERAVSAATSRHEGQSAAEADESENYLYAIALQI